MSMKERWVGPREQVLNVPIACWWYGPSESSSLSSTKVCLKSTASLVGLGEKLCIDLRISQLACYGLCREPLFSGPVGSVQICRWLVKGYHVWGLPAGSIRRAYLDWHGKHMCRVGQVCPCRVYIDLNHRDSRIWVTASWWQTPRW
jgi:hypothetical protein